MGTDLPLSSSALPERSRWVSAALLLPLIELAKVPTNSLTGDKDVVLFEIFYCDRQDNTLVSS